MIEHHIQKELLIRLSKAASLRFSELKPKELESNAFMYHLQQLRQMKLVNKIENGYELSDEGLAYIDGFSFHNLSPRKQPKLISILAIRNPAGHLLVAKRKYQPYIGQYMLVSGKQHLGEDPGQHAARELKEKINLDIPLTRRGLADVRISHGDKLITHVTAHIYEGNAMDDVLPPETSQFAFAWAVERANMKLLAGTAEIIDRLELDQELFYLSLDAKDA